MDKIVFAVVFAILAIHFAASWFSWYFTLWWFDIPMHIAGGAWVALLFFYLFGDKWKALSPSRGFMPTLLLCLGFVALVGVLWEFYEYAYDFLIAGKFSLFGEQSRGLFDALKDLFDDLLGGFGIAVVMYLRGRKQLTTGTERD